MKDYIQLTIIVADESLRDQLIAQLSSQGFDGFEEKEDSLAAFIEEDQYEQGEVEMLLNSNKLAFSTEVIPSQNWNEQWESSFSPVVVGDFCAVRAHFHAPITTVQHEIVITPKMSFGTGHHATTYLMLQEMEQISFANKTVADFGTGTGVLSILAEKLGSSEIWAIDNDDWSIENAKENVQQNNCSHIEIKQLNTFSPSKKYDIIFANINLNIILANLGGLVFGLQKGGLLLLSGLLKQDETKIIKETSKHNLRVIKTVGRENWIAVLLGIH